MIEEYGGYVEGETQLWGDEDATIFYRDERFGWSDVFNVLSDEVLCAEICATVRRYLDSRPELLESLVGKDLPRG